MGTFQLISLDVGDTLGQGTGPSLTAVLAQVSPLPEPVVGAILAEELQTTPVVTDQVRKRLAEGLRITWTAALERAMATPFALFPGTVGAVAELAEIAPTVTLSNSIAWHAHHHEAIRQACGRHLTAVHTSYELGAAKPDVAAFDAVADAHDVDPEDLVHVGDSWQADVLGALDAGARAVWITAGRDLPEVDPNAVDPEWISRIRVARDITAVPKVLRAWASQDQDAP